MNQNLDQTNTQEHANRFPLSKGSITLLAAMSLISCSLLLMQWSWAKWPDILVDFGRELYIPWQITKGRNLYEDLAYFNGPLSPYLNSAVFNVLGTDLNSLVCVNFLFFLGIILMLFRILKQSFGFFPGFASCLMVVFVFGFSQYVGVGNYNYPMN